MSELDPADPATTGARRTTTASDRAATADGPASPASRATTSGGGPSAGDTGVGTAMRDEARALIDAARAQGLTLRLLGGLGVREHCRDLALCARDYSDLDMVAPASGSRRLPAVLARFGYTEDYRVAGATGNGQLQFVRPCRHGESGRPAPHDDDHIDVFLDTFRMDHEIALGSRLHLEPYTLAPTDLLLTKLQIFKLTEKDARDIVTLLDALEVDAPPAGHDATPAGHGAPLSGHGAPADDAEAARPTIDAASLADRCADDWGLFYDVATNLQRVAEQLPGFALDPGREAHVRRGLARLVGALDDAPKNLRFKLRARIGTRVSWHDEVDDQD